ncbi:DUF6639 family protein [Tropicimonas isoalkanivorans]|uniref:DUF6639 family protein n=1 Tax=Tropicimonas isoalkanivorans TaxID=441112 RepID=UPI0011609E2B|nr:DUF6639 family protein [Tropicimonas isoalkanivorans]
MAALSLSIAPALADPVACPDPMFRVEAPTDAFFQQACAAAQDARDAVSVCGLTLQAPVDIQLVENLSLPLGQCLASYDSDRNALAIIRPDLLLQRLGPGDSYASLPPDIVFRSLMRHEMAHALLYQATQPGKKIPLVDHEFVANALEIGGLDEAARHALLDAAKVDWPPTADVINSSIYMLAPRKFAVASWRYYRARGCAPIEAIQDGTYSFMERH